MMHFEVGKKLQLCYGVEVAIFFWVILALQLLSWVTLASKSLSRVTLASQLVSWAILVLMSLSAVILALQSLSGVNLAFDPTLLAVEHFGSPEQRQLKATAAIGIPALMKLAIVTPAILN